MIAKLFRLFRRKPAPALPVTAPLVTLEQLIAVQKMMQADQAKRKISGEKT